MVMKLNILGVLTLGLAQAAGIAQRSQCLFKLSIQEVNSGEEAAGIVSETLGHFTEFDPEHFMTLVLCPAALNYVFSDHGVPHLYRLEADCVPSNGWNVISIKTDDRESKMNVEMVSETNDAALFSLDPESIATGDSKIHVDVTFKGPILGEDWVFNFSHDTLAPLRKIVFDEAYNEPFVESVIDDTLTVNPDVRGVALPATFPKNYTCIVEQRGNSTVPVGFEEGKMHIMRAELPFLLSEWRYMNEDEVATEAREISMLQAKNQVTRYYAQDGQKAAYTFRPQHTEKFTYLYGLAFSKPVANPSDEV